MINDLNVMLKNINSCWYVSANNYSSRVIKRALIDGLITILKHRRTGPRDGIMIRKRKGSECQNEHLLGYKKLNKISSRFVTSESVPRLIKEIRRLKAENKRLRTAYKNSQTKLNYAFYKIGVSNEHILHTGKA